MIYRLFGTLLISSLLLRLIFAVGSDARHHEEVCREVAQEVALAVDSGLLTPSKGNDIIRRCYTRYGGSK